MRSGVPQGTVLGPLMFLVNINDIGKNTEAHLYGVIKDCNDAKSLQQDLDTLAHLADTWQRQFNAKKWTILRVSCSKSPVEYQYTTHREPLQAVDHSKYLGVELSSDLNWDVHFTRQKFFRIPQMTKPADLLALQEETNLNKCPENVKEQAYLDLDGA